MHPCNIGNYVNKNIVNLRTDYTFEVGSNNHRLHCHGIIDLTHTGFYQVNQSFLRCIVNKYLGFNIHLNIQAQKTASAIAWERYIKKTLPVVN